MKSNDKQQTTSNNQNNNEPIKRKTIQPPRQKTIRNLIENKNKSNDTQPNSKQKIAITNEEDTSINVNLTDPRKRRATTINQSFDIGYYKEKANQKLKNLNLEQ